MCDMQEYLKSLNPDGKGLAYDSEYHLWRDNSYLGIATWVKDENVGDSFQTQFINERGVLINQVVIPDKWEKI